MRSKSIKRISPDKLKRLIPLVVIAIFRFILMLGICFVILYPIITKISGSLMTVDDLIDSTVKYIPKNLTFDNYIKAWQMLGMPGTLINSVVLFTIVSVLQMMFCTLVAYGFARYQFKLNGFFFVLVIVQLVIPPDTIMLTRFMQFRYFDIFGIIHLLSGHSIDLINTYFPMMILGITCMGLKNGLFIFMMRQYFKGVPKALEEAAYVDGCGPLKTYFRIILPGAVPMMITIFLFSFVWLWMDTTVTPVLTTIPVIPNVINAISAVSDSTGGLSISLTRNAGIMIILFPLILLYLLTQKFFVQGIERSGLTG